MKFSISICSNVKIDIHVPIKITDNIDKYNSSSGYYNDICYTTTSDSGTDISLNDRKEDYINGNKAVCQDDCVFLYYDDKNQKAQCSCKVKESSSSVSDMVIDKKKLYKNFIDVKNIANINLMVCYEQLFTKIGIAYNIGSYIIIGITIFHIISFVLFYLKGINVVFKKIKNIIIFIKHSKLFKKGTTKEAQNTNNLDNNQKEKSLISNINNNLIDDKEESTIKFISGELKRKRRKRNKNNPPKKSHNKNINANIETQNINYNIININNNKKEKEIIPVPSRKFTSNKKREIKRPKNMIKFVDDEINDLSYDLAIKYDKRTYCDYYFSLLRSKHLFIFSFITSNDYNSRIMKMDLFFIGFGMNYFVNALFFSDDTMHEIYEREGKFDFIYQLPQILYSSLISTVLDFLFNILALSNDAIIDFKKNRSKEGILKRKKDLKFKLKVKFILFFIIGFIFLVFFWYYLSMFCVIYKNTQVHLISDTLMSFGLSFVYPFGMYLVPGIFRIPSLSNPEKKRIYLYKVSKILQFF